MSTEQPNIPQEPKDEIDILALFEYFKNGIKSLFKGIGKIINTIVHLLLNYLLLLKKNWWVVAACVVLLVAFSLFKNSLIGEKYKYQMVVEPQFNSSYALYEQIDALNVEATKGNKAELSGISRFGISPLKSMENEVQLYYEITKNADLSGNPDRYENERDTVFFKSVTLDDFKNQLKDEDYPIQEISIYSQAPIDTKKIKEIILKSIMENPYWESKIKNKVDRINQRESIAKQAIVRTDSLLASYQKRGTMGTQSTISIDGDNAKNNVENDLLNQIKGTAKEIETLQMQKDNSKQLINIVSELKRVGNDTPSSYINPKTAVLWGLILASVIILFIQMVKFLNKYENSLSSK